MGQRGPSSKAPGGYGTISAKGYRRVYDPRERRERMEHVLVWESFNGPVPPGYLVHHRNEDKLDNTIDNLRAVSTTAHKRMHGGCIWKDGQWWKPCKLCGEFKPVGKLDWYISREGWPLYGRCRPCHIGRVVADKRKRRLDRIRRHADG